MESYKVSFVVRRGIVAVTIVSGGILMDKYVRKLPSSVNGQLHSILYAFNTALKHLDKVLSGASGDVEFEHSNYIFEKWVESHYSRPEYQEEFDAAMQKLQRLPVKFKFVHSDKPYAEMYCSDKYIKKEAFAQ